MTQEFVVEITTRAIFDMLIVAGPVLLVGLAVGLAVSIFQAVTQINEMTLTFIPKVLSIFLTIIILLPWMLQRLISFTHYIFTSIPGICK